MSKKGYMHSLKMRLLAFFYRKQKEKEEKKKRQEAIRIWQMQNYGKYYSKPKTFFLCMIGFFVSSLEPKNAKKEICLDSVKSTKRLRSESIRLKEMEAEVKEVCFSSNEGKKPVVLIVKKEKLKQKKEEVKQIEKGYQKITIPSKVVSENVILLEENKKRSQNIHQKIDKEIKNIDGVLEHQKKTLQNVSFVYQDKKKEVSFTVGSVLERASRVSTKVNLDQIEAKLEEEKDIAILSSMLLAFDKMEKKEKDSEIKKRILEDKKKVLAKIEKEEKKQKKLIRSEDDLAEIVLMETLIYNQIQKQKKEIEKIRKRIDTLDAIEKQKGFLGTLMQFLRRSIRLAFSMFPFAVFKNKKIGLLTSSILVNNNIRSMRRAVSKKQIPYIEFEKVASRLRKKEEEVEEAKLVCFDSLDQILYLKNEILLEFGYDATALDAILKEMNQLESMIKSRTKELENTKKEIDKVKQGAKQKVKKLEGIYGKN